MNLDKDKGITIIALIIVVIIMLILLGVGVHFGTDAIDRAKLEDIKTDMLSIKAKAKIIADHYNFKDIEKLVGSPITDEEAQKLNLTDSEKEKSYKWSRTDLDNQGLSTIEGDAYIVYYDLENPNNCEIYYLNGYHEKYSLTDLQNL